MLSRYCILLVSCWCVSHTLKADTLKVFFPVDVAFLDSRLERQLDKFIPSISGGKSILVIGYADADGDTYYNDMLSMRRAQNVAGYLKNNGLQQSNILVVYGRGEVNREKEQREMFRYDRRVDIVPVSAQPAPPAVHTPKRTTVAEQLMPTHTVAAQLDNTTVGETLELKDIQFYPGSSNPLPSSMPAFEELYSAMERNPALRISIEGHICCIEEEEGDTTGAGYRLSVERAWSVYNFLKKKGIPASRMRYKGFSSWHLLEPETSEKARARNRRVEVRVLEK